MRGSGHGDVIISFSRPKTCWVRMSQKAHIHGGVEIVDLAGGLSRCGAVNAGVVKVTHDAL